jgi:hypothetical protein
LRVGSGINNCSWLKNVCYGTLHRAVESRLRVFENGMLGRIFGPKRGKIPEEWTKSYNEELHNLYSLELSNQSI